MRLHKLKIDGFKRLRNIEINLGDATFLIGQNNVGKSTIIKAIETLLSAKKTLNSTDYYSEIDEETGETKPVVTKIIFEAEFRNLPKEAKSWRGFKGRIFEYESNDETGLSVTYRKTFQLGQDVIIEFKSRKRRIKSVFEDCKKPIDYINNGANKEIVQDIFPDLQKNIGKAKSALDKLDSLDEIWELESEEEWFRNPGGIPGPVLNKLPRFLLIPVETAINEIQGSNNGVLGKTLSELFTTVRETSDNFKQAQEYLNKLSKELDPSDNKSEFGKMMKELNSVLNSVFPNSKLHATTDLSDPNKVLKPSFNVEMSSNVKTPIENQGTGMVRAAVFGMLRFRQKWLSEKEDEQNRSLIICFEEPEIYLHPSAANQMRDAIYELSNSHSQIIASTHSPFLIDISRKPRQILNRLYINDNVVKSTAFSVTDSFLQLQDDDKSYVKMILKIDDYISRVFFTKKVIIIEGDTEDILFRETLSRLPKDKILKIKSDFEVIKARGKSIIISLVKYLSSMNLDLIVVHDRDKGIEGAEKFNPHIKNAVGKNGKVILMEENVEDEIGYTANNEKPVKAYLETQKWGENWDDIPIKWRNKMKDIFEDYIA